MSKLYGWLSKSAANYLGYCIYMSPNGLSELLVTYVSSDPEGTNYNWDDKIFVGEVGKLVKSVNRRRSDSVE